MLVGSLHKNVVEVLTHMMRGRRRRVEKKGAKVHKVISGEKGNQDRIVVACYMVAAFCWIDIKGH